LGSKYRDIWAVKLVKKAQLSPIKTSDAFKSKIVEFSGQSAEMKR